MKIFGLSVCAGELIRPSPAPLFVEAEREHRFYDIKEELEVVFFAPAEQE